jgi:WD40 repeat protein
MRVVVWGARELRDGRLLSWSADNTLRLWAADGTEIAVLRGHEGEVRGALELRDGRLLSWSDVTCCALVSFWRRSVCGRRTGLSAPSCAGIGVVVRGALELRDGRLLSWSDDTTLRLWAADGTERAVLRGHEDAVSGALELRDGRLLSWSADTTLRLWAADGTPLGAMRRDAVAFRIAGMVRRARRRLADVHRELGMVRARA